MHAGYSGGVQFAIAVPRLIFIIFIFALQHYFIHSYKHLCLEAVWPQTDHISISKRGYDPWSGSLKICSEFQFSIYKVPEEGIWTFIFFFCCPEFYIKDCLKRHWVARSLENGVKYFYFLKGDQVKIFLFQDINVYILKTLYFWRIRYLVSLITKLTNKKIHAVCFCCVNIMFTHLCTVANVVTGRAQMCCELLKW